MDKVYEGGCLCSAVGFRATGPAGWPHTCSCRMCQRRCGALTLAWVELARDRVEWTGPGGAPATWRSSEKSSRAFCPTCGSTLGGVDHAPSIALVLGTFDTSNRKELASIAHSYTTPRPNWWQIAIGDRP